LNLIGDWGFTAAQPAWAEAIVGSPGHIPAWMKLTADATADGIDALQGDVIGHSQDEFSGAGNGTGNILWTAPFAGLLSISGNAWIARNISRAVEVSVLVNGNPLRTALLFDGDPYDRANPCAIASCFSGIGGLSGIGISAGDTVELRLLTGNFGTNPPVGDFVGVNLTLDLQEGQNVIPEPTTYALLGSALAALALLKRTK
jgi:hypothetical protein